MTFKYLSIRFVSVLILLFPFRITGQDKDLLTIESTKEVGQIEVGSPYVGIEIHKSFPLLNRISFYYPVANSIDISEDYWRREKFRIMSIGLKVGNSSKRFLKAQVYEVSQTPYSVYFVGNDSDSKIKITYEFCKNEPAMVITYEITNTSDTAKEYEVYTRLEATLRTSHTYKLIDSAYTAFQEQSSVIRINYPFKETGNAQIFVMNSGLEPSSFTTTETKINGFKDLDDWWLNTDSSLPETIIPKAKPGKPVAAFIYQQHLSPNGSFKIIQIVGSSLISEGKTKTDVLLSNYQTEVNEYENYIIQESIDKNEIVTGNKDLDFTSRWSKAVMATNAHYLNGHIVPMPAQAEYNFYFTHDALLTDLAAVNFDLSRVKNDLQYIVSLADTDRTIPHAYYWKDTKYITEYAGTENWNHLWFTLVCARYLRHSGDRQLLEQLYPYIEKSIKTALKNKGEDDLMWSPRPDWWDIGSNVGPRAYMTILAIRALREFNFISNVLNHDGSELQFYENLANRMNRKLVDKLWDDKLNYLISYYEDGKEDRHIYMGSLLASHFNLIDDDKKLKLITTAKEKLLDEKLGIYTLYPMDLHLLIDYMKFAGNEAGDPYHYANGGIWPHGNAWYALALINNGLNKDAFEFIKKTMTLNGVINSPNGQPALYEYRISDKNDPALYGKIDKPQFLWAGGWYFYTLYNLFGLRENEWNISFSPFIPEEMDSVQLTVTLKGVPVIVDIIGEGSTLSSILFDGMESPSAVVPEDMKQLRKINLKLGNVKTPYLMSANALVISPMYDRETKKLEFDLESFEDRLIEVQVVSPTASENIAINGKYISSGITESIKNNIYKINIEHIASLKRNHYSIKVK
ncbi:MAG: amylo-alpha-1,6-glucosidase [Vicinamibacterales bacterium]|nr:amylo-alpha-1,6-glucosidase [Vicinamibacterales bacterium]